MASHMATATVERERFLLQRLTLHPETQEKFVSAFLKPPLYSTSFGAGFGTLYTAAYRPADGRLDLHWPGRDWPMSIAGIAEDVVSVLVPEGRESSAG